MGFLSLDRLMLRQKIAALFLMVSLGLTLTVSFTYYFLARHYLIKKATEQLVAIQSMKKNEIERFYKDTRKKLIEYSQKTFAIAGMHYFNTRTYDSDGKFSTVNYNKTVETELKRLKNLVETFGFDEFMYVNFKGTILFSYFNPEFKFIELTDTKYKELNIYKAFEIGTGQFHLTDFESSPFHENTVMCYAATPITEKGKYYGVVLVGLSHKKLNHFFEDYTGLGQTGESYLVGSDFFMRTNSRFSDEPTLLRRKVDHLPVKLALNGKSGVITGTNYLGREVISVYSRIDAIGAPPYAIVSEIETTEILQTLLGMRRIIIWLIVGLAISVFILAFYMSDMISKPINKIKDIFVEMGKGILNTQTIKVDTRDEIKNIAEKINLLNAGLLRTAEFAEKIGQGNLSATFEPLSADDVLGKSLLTMRSNLSQLREQERNREFIATNLASMGAILRQFESNPEYLYNQIAIFFSEKCQSEIVSIYLYDDQQDKLIQKALYAYGKHKMPNNSIIKGEGLAGERFRYKKIGVFNYLSQQYCNIPSGKVGEKPSHLMLVPVGNHLKMFGLIELIGTKPFSELFVELSEKLSLMLASTIETILANLETQKLLAELSDKKFEVEAHEGNINEQKIDLLADSENNKQQLNRLLAIEKFIDSKFAMAIIDKNGVIEVVTNQFGNLTHNSTSYLIGKNVCSFLEPASENAIPFNLVLSNFESDKSIDGHYSWLQRNKNNTFMARLATQNGQQFVLLLIQSSELYSLQKKLTSIEKINDDYTQIRTEIYQLSGQDVITLQHISQLNLKRTQ